MNGLNWAVGAPATTPDTRNASNGGSDLPPIEQAVGGFMAYSRAVEA